MRNKCILCKVINDDSENINENIALESVKPNIIIPRSVHERVYCKKHILEKYDEFLVLLRRTARTRQAYVGCVRRAFAHLRDPFAPGDFGDWIRARRRRCAPRTFNTEIGCLRSFYGWLFTTGIVTTDYRLRLPKMKRVAARLPRWLTPSQIESILSTTTASTPIDLRDQAIVALLYETAATATECVQLDVGAVDFDDRTVLLGSKNRRRRVPVTASLCVLLERWILCRRNLRPGKTTALFISHRGRALSSGRSIWEIVARRARAALGLARGYETLSATAKRRAWAGVGPHALRASYAVEMIEAGSALSAVQQIMGHANVSTTEHYSVRLAELRRAHAKFPR